jgi:hypothetical protein
MLGHTYYYALMPYPAIMQYRDLAWAGVSRKLAEVHRSGDL